MWVDASATKIAVSSGHTARPAIVAGNRIVRLAFRAARKSALNAISTIHRIAIAIAGAGPRDSTRPTSETAIQAAPTRACSSARAMPCSATDSMASIATSDELSWARIRRPMVASRISSAPSASTRP